jgi:hypothetical protein
MICCSAHHNSFFSSLLQFWFDLDVLLLLTVCVDRESILQIFIFLLNLFCVSFCFSHVIYSALISIKTLDHSVAIKYSCRTISSTCPAYERKANTHWSLSSTMLMLSVYVRKKDLMNEMGPRSHDNLSNSCSKEVQPNKKEKKSHKKENGKTQHTPRQTRIFIIYMISIYISKNNMDVIPLS